MPFDLPRIDEGEHAIAVQIVSNLKGGERTVTENDVMAELERLRAENESLKKGMSRGMSIKVSEKGGVSVYGLGRFPLTLYQEQWVKLLDMAEDIRTFIRQHEPELKRKT